MCFFRVRGVRWVVLFLVALLVSGCSLFGGKTSTSHKMPTPGSVSSTGTTQTTPNLVAHSPTIDTIAQQVLVNMHLHAWNGRASTHGQVTGGLFINWKMDDPSTTNALKDGPSDATQSSHDPQVDLFYLSALVDYHLVHPQDHAFDDDLNHAVTIVLNDFRTYNLPKGWVYFYLLRCGQIMHNQALIDEAHNVASRTYSNWYDPQLGFVYDHHRDSAANYSPNLSLQAGAAMIDAGMRWQQPDWVNAGNKTMKHVITAAMNPQYHLLYNTMIVSNDGHDQPQNAQAKPSTQGEAVIALMYAYNLTHQQLYLDTSGQLLQSLYGASRLWDQQRGGFFFALDMGSNKLLTSYKETRSQTLVLMGVHQYNQVRNQAFAQQEKDLVNVLTGHFYESTYHGFFYRVSPSFQVYVDKPGQGIGVEDYFTTEAMGSALDALQKTELSS